jgi:glycosyltransferase involved in cell wall biosynthesis
MIGTAWRVVRGEGAGSVLTRGSERASEALRLAAALARGTLAAPQPVPVVNVLTTLPAPRLGGVAVQFLNRISEERKLRPVAIQYPGVVRIGDAAWRRDAIEAQLTVLEGTAGLDLDRVPDNVVVNLHDLTLLAAGMRGAELLRRARAVIVPSTYLREAYRPLFDGEVQVIEPGVPPFAGQRVEHATRIAFAGAVKPHKGAALLPEIMAANPGAEWHLFGGGDVELLRALRRLPRVHVHGYYRAGALPSLLVRHGIGLALLPSLVPESYSLTLSECWQAGVPAVTFAHGAQGERIGRGGGGWTVPLADGAAGIADVVQQWRRGALTTDIPRVIASSAEAAAAHVALVRSLV